MKKTVNNNYKTSRYVHTRDSQNTYDGGGDLTNTPQCSDWLATKKINDKSRRQSGRTFFSKSGRTFFTKSGLTYFAAIDWRYMLPPILACLCYINGLTGDLVHDDNFAIRRNNDVIGRTPLGDVFRNDFWGRSMASNRSHKSYRPLTVLTFRLNYWLYGEETLYYHVVNVALHVIVTWLFVYSCRHVFRLGGKCSVLAGMLFAVHPVHVEAVTGIVGRADLMAGMFFLLSLIAYSKAVLQDDDNSKQNGFPWSSWNQVVSLFLTTLAMLSKENGITVLGVCVVYDVVVTYRMAQSRGLTMSGLVKCGARISVTLIYTLVLIMVRIKIMAGTLPKFTAHDNPAAFQNSTLTKVLTHSYVWTQTLTLLLAPSQLCYDWQHGSIPLVESLHDTRNLATLTAATLFLFVVAYIVACLILGLKSATAEAPLWSMVVMIVSFLPASNIVFTVGFVIAERVLYIPSFGMCMLIAAGICRIRDNYPRYARIVTTAVCLLLALHAAKTYRQNNVWQSREALFRSGVSVMPHNAKVHYNYGNFLKDTGQVDHAIAYYREALRLDPTYASAHNNLGSYLEDSFEAEVHFREALRLHPTHQGAHINLGTLLYKRGVKDDGLQLLQTAVQLERNHPEALVALAWVLIDMRNYTEADTYLQACLELSPGFPEAHLHYGLLMNRLGRHQESAQHYMKAHQLQPGHVPSLTNAADAYTQLKDFPTAETLLKKALLIRQDAEVLEQLAVLYHGAGRTHESLDLYKQMDSQQLHNTSDTVVRYAKVLATGGNLQQADQVLTEALTSFPGHIELVVTAALVKSNMKQFQEAVLLMTKAISLTSKDRLADLEKMYFDRGNNYKDMNQLDNALMDFEETLKINPNHSEAHGNNGAIHHINGNIGMAKYHYTKALQLQPDNAILKSNIAKLERLESKRERGVG